MSREFANFTYDLKPENKDYLAWFVANICGVSHSEMSGYFSELEENSCLSSYIREQLSVHRRGKEIDDVAYYGRRIGWYGVVRALKPSLIVETGTEKGLGSLVLAEALLQNGQGRLITIDIEPSSGLLIGERYRGIVERIIGDSLDLIQHIDEIDLFIHDSDHSAEFERREFELVLTRMSTHGLVISDNSHATNELAKWSQKHNRTFHYFAEEPLNHWYHEAGIGISIPT